MVLPVRRRAAQQVRPAQERAVGRASRRRASTWLPPPVPVWRPSSMNFSVPRRASARVLVERRGRRPSSSQLDAGWTLTSITPGSGVTWMRRSSARIARRRRSLRAAPACPARAAVASTAATQRRRSRLERGDRRQEDAQLARRAASTQQRGRRHRARRAIALAPADLAAARASRRDGAGPSRRASAPAASRSSTPAAPGPPVVALDLDRHGQRVERQAEADRRVAGHQQQRVAAQQPRRRVAMRRADASPRERQHVADRRGRARAPKTRAQPLALCPLVEIAIGPGRRWPAAPLAPEVVQRVLVRRPITFAVDAEARRERLREAPRVVGVDAVVARLGREQRRVAPERHAVACASSSRAPSAAAARPDTICPARSAAAPPGANAVAQALQQRRTARSRLSAPSAAVFHSSPSMSSIDTNVGSPPIVSRTSLRDELRVDRVAERVGSPPTARRCTAW